MKAGNNSGEGQGDRVPAADFLRLFVGYGIVKFLDFYIANGVAWQGGLSRFRRGRMPVISF